MSIITQQQKQSVSRERIMQHLINDHEAFIESVLCSIQNIKREILTLMERVDSFEYYIQNTLIQHQQVQSANLEITQGSQGSNNSSRVSSSSSNVQYSGQVYLPQTEMLEVSTNMQNQYIQQDRFNGIPQQQIYALPPPPPPQSQIHLSPQLVPSFSQKFPSQGGSIPSFPPAYPPPYTSKSSIPVISSHNIMDQSSSLTPVPMGMVSVIPHIPAPPSSVPQGPQIDVDGRLTTDRK